MTYTPNGECRGIRLKRAGDKCRIVDFWKANTDQNHTATEILAEGAKALSAKDASCYVAGGTAPGWGMADVSMPPLPPQQLRNALAFELKKHTPLPVDKLKWGYRLIAKQTNTTKPVYRIVYAKSELWQDWCNAFSATAPLDAIIPAPATLDPSFDKQTVIFPRHGKTGEAYLPNGNGRTFKPALSVDADGNPMPLIELLGIDFLVQGTFDELSVAEQYEYADALILAIYGLTGAIDNDAETLIPMPDALKPHRSALLVVTACLLLAVTIASLILWAVMTLQANYSQQNELKQEIADIEREINEKRASIKTDRLKKVQELLTELQPEVPDYPPFPMVLNAITEIFDSETERQPWISSKLTWNHDTNTIKFSIEEPLGEDGEKAFIEQPELIDALADCPYIVDVRGNSSTINRNDNKCVREFTITIGWQTKEQRDAAAERNAKRAQERRMRRAKKEQEIKEREQAKARAKAAVAAAQAQAQAQAQHEETEDKAQPAVIQEMPADGSEMPPPPPSLPNLPMPNRTR